MAKPTPVYVGCKRCRTCKRVKSLSQFDRHGNGHRNVCRSCLTVARETADRTCTRCGETKPIEAFPRNGAHVRNVCNDPCWLAEKRDRYWGDPKRAGLERPEYVKRVERPAPDGHKWCTKCDECKPIGQFNRREYGGRQGHTSWCISCMTEHKMKQSRENPEVLAGRNAASRRWHARNPDFAEAYRRENADLYREWCRAAAARRRSRLQSLPSEPYTTAQLVERDGTRCVLGGEELNFDATFPHPETVTIEHLVPLSWLDSPGDVLSNVGLACLNHNCSRSNKPHPAAARKRAELLAAERAAEPA